MDVSTSSVICRFQYSGRALALVGALALAALFLVAITPGPPVLRALAAGWIVGTALAAAFRLPGSGRRGPRALVLRAGGGIVVRSAAGEWQPGELRGEMMAWCRANLADERKDGETEEQFLYKTRKKAIGPFKRELWDLPDGAAGEIAGHLRDKFGFLFDQLKIRGTRALVERFVHPVAAHRPLPEALGGGGKVGAVAGAAVFEDDGSGE